MKKSLTKPKDNFKNYRRYYIAYTAFLVCLFASPHVYAFFFDFHASNAYEHYEMDKRDWERNNPGEIAYMTFGEWQQKEDEHYRSSLEYLGNECASLFDPWHEPVKFDRDFGREE